MRPSQGIDKSAEAASVKPGDRVLDVGCGTGVLSREVADRAGSDGRVFGLDVNEDMLALARRICPDIDWHQGDAGELPFDDTSFEAVVSQFALMFVPDQMAALQEMWRVLASSSHFHIKLKIKNRNKMFGKSSPSIFSSGCGIEEQPPSTTQQKKMLEKRVSQRSLN